VKGHARACQIWLRAPVAERGPAVDAHVDPRDERCRVGGQKDNGGSDLLRLCAALHRMAVRQALQQLQGRQHEGKDV
jgi:hypothetical protein